MQYLAPARRPGAVPGAFTAVDKPATTLRGNSFNDPEAFKALVMGRYIGAIPKGKVKAGACVVPGSPVSTHQIPTPLTKSPLDLLQPNIETPSVIE